MARWKNSAVQNFAKSASGAALRRTASDQFTATSWSDLGINGGFKSQKLLGFGALFFTSRGRNVSLHISWGPMTSAGTATRERARVVRNSVPPAGHKPFGFLVERVPK